MNKINKIKVNFFNKPHLRGYYDILRNVRSTNLNIIYYIHL